MQSVEELWKAYQDWKRLSEQEGTAIQRSQWFEVESAQAQKRLLQAEIVRLTDQIKATINSSIEQEQFNSRLRGTVNELILLETQNNVKIESMMSAAEDQRRNLLLTANRLRQVHHRYVPAREPVWENLS
jgi:hypothetical protein